MTDAVLKLILALCSMKGDVRIQLSRKQHRGRNAQPLVQDKKEARDGMNAFRVSERISLPTSGCAESA